MAMSMLSLSSQMIGGLRTSANWCRRPWPHLQESSSSSRIVTSNSLKETLWMPVGCAGGFSWLFFCCLALSVHPLGSFVLSTTHCPLLSWDFRLDFPDSDKLLPDSGHSGRNHDFTGTFEHRNRSVCTYVFSEPVSDHVALVQIPHPTNEYNLLLYRMLPVHEQ